MKIHVTLWDILMGSRYDPLDCKIARAIKRAHPEAISVSVGRSIVGIDEQVVNLPQLAKDKIDRWDAGRFVLPYSFELALEPTKAQLQSIGQELEQLEAVNV